jgi:hypothetical protein
MFAPMGVSFLVSASRCKDDVSFPGRFLLLLPGQSPEYSFAIGLQPCRRCWDLHVQRNGLSVRSKHKSVVAGIVTTMSTSCRSSGTASGSSGTGSTTFACLAAAPVAAAAAAAARMDGTGVAARDKGAPLTGTRAKESRCGWTWARG